MEEGEGGGVGKGWTKDQRKTASDQEHVQKMNCEGVILKVQKNCLGIIPALKPVSSKSDKCRKNCNHFFL